MRKGLIFICFFAFLLVIGLIIQTAYGQGQKEQNKVKSYTSAQVARGKYLALNVSLCLGCHTPSLPDGLRDKNKSFAGGRQFLSGKLWSPNITMDEATGIGKWTDKQIIEAIRNGIDDEGKPLLPNMPYYVFANMKKKDALTIIVYLRTEVKPIRNEIPERAESIVPASPSPLLNYAQLPGTGKGKYLVTGVGLCSECHTVRIQEPGKPSDLARLDLAKYLAGGREFNPKGYKSFSANITSDNTGIALWKDKQIKAAIRDGKDIGGGQLCVPMPKFSELTNADLNDIVKYLRKVPAINNIPPECQILNKPTQ